MTTTEPLIHNAVLVPPVPTTYQVTAAVRAHLAALPGGECPFCHGDKWQPMTWAHVGMSSSPDGPPVGSMTCVMLRCAGCAYVCFMAADTLGLV